MSRELIFETGRVRVTPATNYLQLATRWVKALREAYAGERTVAEALTAAAHDIDRLVRT